MQETIAVIFDFDDTLAPDTTSGYLQQHGLKAERFWIDEVNPLYGNDWDPVPAYLYKMLSAAQDGRIPLNKSTLSEWGKSAPLHAGTNSIFTRLRRTVEETNPTVALEFYVISSGIGDVLRNTNAGSSLKCNA